MTPERRVMSKTEVRPLVLGPPEDGSAVVPLAAPFYFPRKPENPTSISRFRGFLASGMASIGKIVKS